MFTNISTLSFGKILKNQKMQSPIRRTLQLPSDIVELSSKDENQNIINTKRYSFLTSSVTDEGMRSEFGFTRNLTRKEAIFAIKNSFDDNQVQAYIDLLDNYLLPRESYDNNADVKKVNRYLSLISKEKNEKGEFVSGFSRPLKVGEALGLIKSMYDNEQIQTFIELKEDNLDLHTVSELLEKYQEYKAVLSIDELTPLQKKSLMRKLTARKSMLKYFPKITNGFTILPKSNEEYCSTLNSLSKSIGVPTKPLNEEEKILFSIGLEQLPSILRFANFDKLSIELDYSTEKFVDDVSNVLKGLDSLSQLQVTDYFGFEIKDGVLKGYPALLYETSDDIKDEKIKKIVEQISPFVEKYSIDNRVSIPENLPLENAYNNILEALPEIRTIIGKKQTSLHSYTLDKYSLKVVQNIVRQKGFNKLSFPDKRVLIIAALLQDLTKAEGLVDKTHPNQSAFDSYYILQKLGLSQEEQLKIYSLIKTHEWFNEIGIAERSEFDTVLKDVVFNLRYSNVFELSKMLVESNIKSIKQNNAYWDSYKSDFIGIVEELNKKLQDLRTSQIFLPQTRIPKASEIKNGMIENDNGVQNVVLYVDDLEDDLSIYGFERGTTKENYRSIVHTFLDEVDVSIVNTFSNIDSDEVLSACYISPKSYNAFRQDGVIVDVHPSDIHIGYYEDFGSNYKKDSSLLKYGYLFSDSLYKNGERCYISDIVKQKLRIKDSEYVERMARIEGCNSITEIEEKDPILAEVLNSILDEINQDRDRDDSYNEFLISRPKIKAVFTYEKEYNEIPLFLRKYAMENDFLVLIFGMRKKK